MSRLRQMMSSQTKWKSNTFSNEECCGEDFGRHVNDNDNFFDLKFVDMKFKDCNFFDMDADLSTYINCVFENCTFASVKARRLRFNECILMHCQIDDCIFPSAVLEKCELKDIRIKNTNCLYLYHDKTVFKDIIKDDEDFDIEDQQNYYDKCLELEKKVKELENSISESRYEIESVNSLVEEYRNRIQEREEEKNELLPEAEVEQMHSLDSIADKDTLKQGISEIEKWMMKFKEILKSDTDSIEEKLEEHDRFLYSGDKALQPVVFEAMDLSKFDFSGRELDYACFKKCNLEKANFTHCTLKETRFISCCVKDAVFIEANIDECIFEDTDSTVVDTENRNKKDFQNLEDKSITENAEENSQNILNDLIRLEKASFESNEW